MGKQSTSIKDIWARNYQESVWTQVWKVRGKQSSEKSKQLGAKGKITTTCERFDDCLEIIYTENAKRQERKLQPGIQQQESQGNRQKVEAKSFIHEPKYEIQNTTEKKERTSLFTELKLVILQFPLFFVLFKLSHSLDQDIPQRKPESGSLLEKQRVCLLCWSPTYFLRNLLTLRDQRAPCFPSGFKGKGQPFTQHSPLQVCMEPSSSGRVHINGFS